jgi:DNA-binding beta-propeller fold protein YncE
MVNARHSAAGACLMLTLAATVSAPASAQTYKAIGEYKLTGSSAKGIAVDSDGRRLFIASGDSIAVLNADTGVAMGSIDGLKGAQEVMLVPEMKGEEIAPSTHGFAADAAGNVIEFSVADMKRTAAIQMEAPGATSLCYDKFTNTIEAVSGGGSLATIDPATGKVVSSGKVPTGSGQIVCGTLGHVYVADTAANVVHVFNHHTMQNDGDLPMKTGHKPTGITLDTKGRRLFVSCDDGVIEIIDTDAGFTFIELKGGKGAAHETFAWVPQGKGQWKAAAFIVQEDGTLSGVRMMAYINYIMGGQYKLGPGLGSVAYDDKTHHLFITAMHGGSPVVLVAGY